MTATITVTGLPQTVKTLEALPRKIQKRAVNKAIRAGGAPFVKAAKRLAPQRTGRFKRSLTQKVKTYKSGAYILSIIGQQKNAKLKTKKLKKGRGGISGAGELVPIHFMEEDIRPHVIEAGARRKLVINGSFVSRAKHPGVKGRHFMRRAAQSAEKPGLAAFQDKLAAEVDREAAAIAVT